MKGFFCVVVACVLCLSCGGCGWMDGSYVSVTPHQVGYLETDDDLFVVSNYSQLRSALTGLIDSGGEEALITLVAYPQNQVLTDIENAIAYATSVYPIGAYAVESITYEHGNSSGQETISIEVCYRHSKAEIDQIHNVRGIDGAKSAIGQALATFQRSLVLQITSYEDVDFLQMIDDYSAAHPDIVMERPQVTVQTFPKQGLVRILELQFTYQSNRESLRMMQEQVEPIFSSAELYVSPDAKDDVKLSQLYNFLMQRFDYTIQSSITPSYSLLVYGIGDSRAFADVFGAMCRQVGLDALTVSGTCAGESRFWNIVRCEDTYYHVDLMRSHLDGQFQLYTDNDMQNYVWDYSSYPPCGKPVVPEAINRFRILFENKISKK